MMLTEGGEERLETNVNFLLEEYGVLVNTGGCGGDVGGVVMMYEVWWDVGVC